ncbi:hypothetical protein [Burkholderia stagnalis]|uniref:hypothetical protein n=1 Tax=Burkholderia stagnalis TaxID=1503054 RepID=UPI0012DA399B|nr:hypothetical protein [Burkholderia stagnalis]
MREMAAGLEFVERHPGYDTLNNPRRLTVAELMPIGLTWRSGGVRHAVTSQAGVAGRLLGDASGIAVVEAPYDLATNCAYIVNADGSLRARIPAQIGADRVAFYDVIDSGGSVAFLAAAQGKDLRIEIRETDGAVVRVEESR